MTTKTPAQLTTAADVADGDLLLGWRGAGPLKSFTATILATYLFGKLAFLKVANNLSEIAAADAVTPGPKAAARANIGAASSAANTFAGKQTFVASSSAAAGVGYPPGAAPTSPSDGAFWTTTSGLFYYLGGVTFGPAAASDIRTGTSAGAQVSAKALIDAAAFQTLTDQATVAWDMAVGFNAKVTLGGNRTLATPTNPREGLTYTLLIVQDGSGSRTLALPSSSVFDFGGATSPILSTAAGKTDRLYLQCLDATAPKFTAAFVRGS